MQPSVPVIDLASWFRGEKRDRADVAYWPACGRSPTNCRCEADHDAVVEALKPPIGKPNDYGPVVSAQFLKERLDAITVG